MDEPTQIGRYHVVGHLASGGMAEILLGKLFGPSGFERPVVIKRILPHLVRNAELRSMFLDEARVVARIQHPNVVHVQELGESDDELFMVMEYLEGESVLSLLRRSLSKHEMVPAALAAHIVAQSCAGLHAAHELTDAAGEPLGLVHRDVSPSNVFVTYAGAVKLLDFGIAKFAERKTDTEAGTLKGKFAYMSPEQCLAAPLDRRSDVFSLGIVLFEMVSARRLFARENSLLTMKAITEQSIPSLAKVAPHCPAGIAAVCDRALQRQPEDRYQTAAEMRRALLEAMRDASFHEVPDEALAGLMSGLFPDRIEQKQDLLRRVVAGSEITQLPGADVDSSVELPTVGVSQLSHTSALALPARRRRKSLWVAAVLLVGGGIGAVLAFQGAEPEPPPVAASEPVVPETASVRIRSNPAGAQVAIDGVRRGVTPFELDVPRSDVESSFTLTLDGHESVTRAFVPDQDGRWELALPALAEVEAETTSDPTTETGAPPPRSMRHSVMMRTPRMHESAAPMGMADTSMDSPFRRFN